VKWFQPKTQEPKPLPKIPLDYPSDVIVETENGWYFIKGKSKFKINSERIFQSWRVKPLLGTDASVSKFKNAGMLGFRNGTLVRNIADSKYYLISENKRRHITTPDVFDRFGFDEYDAILVSQSEIDIHEEGEVLS
jgi:hypothetical protein